MIGSAQCPQSFIVDIPGSEESIRRAFTAMTGERRIDGLIVSADVQMTPHRRLIADLARAARLPAIALQGLYAEATF